MQTPEFQINPKSILLEAPQLVNSFCEGHWELMLRLKNDARDILSNQISGEDIPKIKSFLQEVVYLKRPHNCFPELSSRLDKSEEEILKAFDSIRNVSRLDYKVFDSISKIPYFGLHGGRSFASAIMRLCIPRDFGIIDWRNLAVLGGCGNFKGLFDKSLTFDHISCEEILNKRGFIFFDDSLYREYNNILRLLADDYEMQCSEVDLVIWVYSLQKESPIKASVRITLFDSVFVSAIDLNRGIIHSDLSNKKSIVDSAIQKYLSRMMDDGFQMDDALLAELSSIFKFIANECKRFSQKKAKTTRHKSRLKDIYDSLITLAKSKKGENILAKWHEWENKLSPGSTSYAHLNLPTDMILNGYLVLEDLVAIRQWFQEKYVDGSFEPR